MDYQFIWGGAKLSANRKHISHGDLLKKLEPHRWYVLAIDDNNHIVGLVSLVKSSFSNPAYVGLGAIEVAPAFRHQGIAKHLMKMMLRLSRKVGKGLRMTAYAPDGERYLRPFMRPLATTMSVELLETT
jgi:predicted N-acetyltransferase YhbS